MTTPQRQHGHETKGAPRADQTQPVWSPLERIVLASIRHDDQGSAGALLKTSRRPSRPPATEPKSPTGSRIDWVFGRPRRPRTSNLASTTPDSGL